MFNVQSSEFIFLLVIALIVLGPEKLPDAVRKFGRAYAEFKKMANGFQGEIRSALEEPLRELQGTADAVRQAANFDLGSVLSGGNPDATANTTAAATHSQPELMTDADRMDFGLVVDQPAPAEPEQRETGWSFTSAEPTPPAPPSEQGDQLADRPGDAPSGDLPG